jgi:hypothetical protein
MSDASAVERALGERRTHQLIEGTERMLRLASSAPSFTESLTHLLLPLRSRNPADNASEINRLVNPDPAIEWNYVTFVKPDGTNFAKANPFMHRLGSLGSQEWVITFTLAEQFMRLGAWWFTQVWRAAELAAAARDALNEWSVLVAAACARSLLEGAAYLTEESELLVAHWNGFKCQGEPSIENLNTFVQELNKSVTILQYASRIGQAQKQPPQVLSKNVMTYMQKLAKREAEFDVMGTYEWLCDAVHPSFGSTTTYLAAAFRDEAKTHVLERYERHPLETLVTKSRGLEPRVAQRSADAVILATQLLGRDLVRTRWVIEDICLTADIAKALKLDAPLASGRPERNAQCPCGSGRKFKRCIHRWGEAGTPLSQDGSHEGAN